MAGLYIHYPFCLAKCAYCDFFSIPYRPELAHSYCQAMLREIETAVGYPHQLQSIYFGGGTPSLMEPQGVEAILHYITGHFKLSDPCEITLEANPGTVTPSKLKAFKDAGINRVSLGVQSFSQQDLKLLGRIHGRQEIFQAVEWLHDLEMENFGIDLIYGLPSQSMDAWVDNLKQAIDLDPAHISCYLLQLEDDVPLGRLVTNHQVHLLTEDEEADMYYRTIQVLAENGFQHYELSNFCRPGKESRHNLNYWRAGEYLGIGAGAVSFRGDTRYKNPADVEQYLESLVSGRNLQTIQLEVMDLPSRLADAIILGLRLTQGINTAELAERFGADLLKVYEEVVNDYTAQGMLELKPPYLRLTNLAYFLSNQVFREFLRA